MYDYLTWRVIEARDVKFIDETLIKSYNRDEIKDDLLILENEKKKSVKDENSLNKYLPLSIEKEEIEDEELNVPEIRVESANDTIKAPGRASLVRTGNRGRPRKLFQSHAIFINNNENSKFVSSDIKDIVFAGVAEVNLETALKGSASDEWKDAIEQEVMSLVEKDTFDIVKKNEEESLVGCRLVLKNKYNVNVELERRKARLEAKGYSQKFGVDYHQTFAPVGRLETLRLLLAISV